MNKAYRADQADRAVWATEKLLKNGQCKGSKTRVWVRHSGNHILKKTKNEKALQTRQDVSWGLNLVAAGHADSFIK
ncbi:hypothetical protein V1477_016441 [Vespula maculifrons]|uniref:Uncharacterized protein n=2 Tax=Vespula TaxID=7451 RepID=A0A834K410_VESVU|nr:hypothetical protein HZH66_006894 [Vespula vulgaris]